MAINPLAVGGGIVGAAAVVGGGLYAGGVFSGGSKEPNKVVEQEPDRHYLFQDSNYSSKIAASSGEYNDKYGQKYSLFLVGVTSSSSAVTGPAADNTKWWDWSYRKNYKPVQDNAEEGFSKSLIKDGTTLMNACAKAYGAGKEVASEKITVTGTGGVQDAKYKEAEVWRFCTPFGEKVKTVSDMKDNEESYTANTTYGGHNTNKTDLVAIKATSKANQHFWKVTEDKLKNAQDSDFDSTSANTSEFKKLQSRLKGTGTDSAKTTLKETCEEAYKKTKEGESTHPKADTGKFCSVSGKALTEPTQ